MIARWKDNLTNPFYLTPFNVLLCGNVSREVKKFIFKIFNINDHEVHGNVFDVFTVSFVNDL